MTITILDKSWEVEIWPGRPDQAPNAVYLRVRHKPKYGQASDLPPSGIVFGITESEAYRLAFALVEAATGDHEKAIQAVRSMQEPAAHPKAAVKPAGNATALPKELSFTKTQGRYLAFIHRYMKKFGCAPAEADIQRHFLVSAPSVNTMMKTLTQKRLISRVPGVGRSIQLLVPPSLLPGEE